MLGNKEIEKSEETNEGHTSFILSPYLFALRHLVKISFLIDCNIAAPPSFLQKNKLCVCLAESMVLLVGVICSKNDKNNVYIL